MMNKRMYKKLWSAYIFGNSDYIDYHHKRGNLVDMVIYMNKFNWGIPKKRKR